ncbi:hypothetical protein BDF14DRAFT_1866380 [Spinellus fusiger]|nr:hypothetical protein BDF14DRAFT_1866380 [Spinellus fusiger]
MRQEDRVQFMHPGQSSRDKAMSAASGERAHHYSLPNAVLASTASHHRHFTPTGLPTSSIPGSQELVNMKADLERLLPEAETRLQYLKKDAKYIERTPKLRDDKSKCAC